MERLGSCFRTGDDCIRAYEKEVIIYDYVDIEVPVLVKMHAGRRAGYKALGYEINLPEANKSLQLALGNL
jgi:hypothetical protein